jgi:hypothetical protein
MPLSLYRLSIPITDSHGRIITVLGGTPRDVEGWKIVTDGAAKLMKDNADRLSVSDELVNHRRAQEPYAAVSRGFSYGGGQMVSNRLPFPFLLLMSTQEPGNLQQSRKNTAVTDELLAHEYFKRLSKWANRMFPSFFMWSFS